MSRCPFLNELWHDLAGKKYKKDSEKKLPPLNELWESEWSEDFIYRMHVRMILGAFRYGKLSDNKDKNYNWIDNAIIRLNEYKETGNIENLIDVANFMMVASLLDKHPKKHFYFNDDESIHLELK